MLKFCKFGCNSLSYAWSFSISVFAQLDVFGVAENQTCVRFQLSLVWCGSVFFSLLHGGPAAAAGDATDETAAPFGDCPRCIQLEKRIKAQDALINLLLDKPQSSNLSRLAF